MESHCLSSAQLPGSSKLYAAFLNDFARVASWYGHPPHLESALGDGRNARVAPQTLSRLLEILRAQNCSFSSDASVAQNLDRLQRGAVAVVAGQQAGLLTGPAYTIHKAATAIAVARELTRRGLDAVPVFWMATEDHDLAEVNRSIWLDDGTLHELRVSPSATEAGRSVGAIPLGSAAAAVARQAISLLKGPDAGAIAAMLAEALRPGETFGSSFAKLLARIFYGRGLILLDPAAPEIHRLAAPLLRSAIASAAHWNEQVLARNQALERAGFHVQVKVTEASTALFLHVQGKRTALRLRAGQFVAAHLAFSAEQLVEELDRRPEDFSANALFRPVLQDSLLPTAAFVAGPAEIAYLAQSAVLYQDVLGRMPVVLPRAGFTLVEPHVARILKKYGLTPEAVITGAASVRRRIEAASLPQSLAGRFEEGEKEMRARLRRLAPALGKLDRTLLGALRTGERKMLYQWRKLRQKAERAHSQRGNLVERHTHVLLHSLFPHHAPQERSLCMLPLLARHGLRLLDTLEQAAAETGTHRIVYL
jgi:bacillithiol biosynthesis cysteine-adding enzyme BshC